MCPAANSQEDLNAVSLLDHVCSLKVIGSSGVES